MEKQYPYVTDNGRTLVLGKSVDAKNEDEKLPPAPKTIVITRQTSKMIDITDMSNEELDNLLFNTPPPKPVIDMIAFFFLP